MPNPLPDSPHYTRTRKATIKQIGKFIRDKVLSINVVVPDAISKAKFLTIYHWRQTASKPVRNNPYSFSMVGKWFASWTRTTTETPIAPPYISAEKKDERQPGIKIIRVPADFTKRVRYTLIITVRPLYETIKHSVSICVRDKSNKMDLALLDLMYRTTDRYQITCYTRGADNNLREISNTWFMNDNS
uniref:Uncharacterized protein n=1 Tax=Romanomermis culicivorax TaxID=13658 RepID=A0A915II21_ROMCU